ncbi:MAG: hypothetical protein WDN44_13115 [Sphingomonas sp.]
MDHIEHSTGEEAALKADFAYNFNNDSFLKRIKFGARYADRDQTIRATPRTIGARSAKSGRAAATLAATRCSWTRRGAIARRSFNFPDFFRGQIPGPVGGNYYNGDLINGYGDASTFFKSVNDIWHNQHGATATNRWVPAAERPGVVPGTPYLPSEIQTVSERNLEGYLMASFGSDNPIFGNVRLDGNVGVRVANTQMDSGGAFTIPTQTCVGRPGSLHRRHGNRPLATSSRRPAGSPPGTPPSAPGGVCNLGAAAYAQLRTFANGANFPNNGRQQIHLLPAEPET